MTRVLILVAALAFAFTGAARASEQSELLYSRGLVAFNAEKYQDALGLFDQAVAADAKDPYALYYRGVTRERLGNFPDAISDLRAALRLRPNLDQAAFELGYALVQTGQYADAIPLLQQAQSAPDLDGEASLYLGLAQLRLGQTSAALQSFQRAAQRKPALALTASYYQGVAQYQAGNFEAAQQQFTHVATVNPDSEMGREAGIFLERLKRGERGPVRNYDLYGTLALQYDSNVTLTPNDTVAADDLGISGKADGRFTILAGGSYHLVQTEKTDFSVGYEFFQSLHFDLTEFNIQDHRPFALVTHDAGPVFLGFLTRYDYYLQETSSFMQQVTTLPWLAVPEGDFGRTVVFFRWWWRNFYQAQYRIRDAYNYAPGIKQFFYLGAPDRYLELGYRYSNEAPQQNNVAAESFGYSGNQIEAGGGWKFPWDVTADLLFAYTRENYASESDGRVDNEYQVVFVARKWLNDWAGVSAGYFGTFDDSNKQEFAYDRNIGSIALDLRY